MNGSGSYHYYSDSTTLISEAEIRMSKPHIGVSGAGIASLSVKAALKMLEEGGANPVFLTERDPARVSAQLAELDALVILGNDFDINPEDYGETQLHPESKIARDPSQYPDIPEGERASRWRHCISWAYSATLKNCGRSRWKKSERR